MVLIDSNGIDPSILLRLCPAMHGRHVLATALSEYRYWRNWSKGGRDAAAQRRENLPQRMRLFIDQFSASETFEHLISEQKDVAFCK
jgi:hypothetical protein